MFFPARHKLASIAQTIWKRTCDRASVAFLVAEGALSEICTSTVTTEVYGQIMGNRRKKMRRQEKEGYKGTYCNFCRNNWGILGAKL